MNKCAQKSTPHWAKCLIDVYSWWYLASFPGSHIPERKHWSMRGEPGILLMWEAPKVERGGREILIARGRTWHSEQEKEQR